MLPRDGPAAVKRRLDYRPPAFLVDRVALELDLEPAATEVKATLAFRRNPAAAAEDRRAPLVLDGEQQDNIRVELDGLEFEHGAELEREVVEGAGHTGLAAVVQLVARKPS